MYSPFRFTCAEARTKSPNNLNFVQRFCLPIEERDAGEHTQTINHVAGSFFRCSGREGSGRTPGHLRFPITASAEVVDIRSGTRLMARVADLSICGCYVDTQSPFPKNTTVRLSLENEKQKMETLAVVVYASIPMGMGLVLYRNSARPTRNSWVLDAQVSEGEPPRELGVVTPAPGGITRAELTNSQLVLNELIYLMVRKKLITENEGLELLRKMFQ